MRSINSFDLLPLFPFFKIISLVAVFVIFQNEALFVYSTSFIAVSVFIRLLVGNPYAFTRKYIDNECVLQCYYFINAVLLFSVFLIYQVVDIDPSLDIMFLVFCVKVLESVISSLIFRDKLGRKLVTFLDKVLSVSLLINLIAFLVILFEFGLNSAVKFEFIVLSVVFVVLLRVQGVCFKNIKVKLVNTVFRSNFEIALTVLPVSFLVIYYASTGSQLLSYAALAFSFAGFINRPLSFIIARAKKIDYKTLSKMSHIISFFILMLLVFIQFNHDYYFFYLLTIGLSLAVVLQNIVRLYIYSVTNISLSKYHVIEAVVVALSCVYSNVALSLSILVVTRTIRLFVIRFYE